MRIIPLVALGLSQALVMTGCASPPGATPTAPIIRMNQTGFEADAAQSATIVTPADRPLSWRVNSSDGQQVRRGATMVFGHSPASGDHVHTLTIAPPLEAGEGYTLIIDNQTTQRFDVRSAPYGDIAERALGYFYLNRAGAPIEAAYAPGPQWSRAAGHPHERATCFADEDLTGLQWSGCDYVLDVTGGWYDAGDHGKYVVNGGISAWMLQNAAERMRQRGGADVNGWGDGRAKMPEAGNGIPDILDEARWQVEFLMAMQAPDGAVMNLPVGRQSIDDGQSLELTRVDASGMAHHKVQAAAWPPLPLLPEDDRAERFLMPPSTAATLNLVAVSAQCARLWRDLDDAFADQCLDAAVRGYEAATRNPEIYAYNIFDGGGAYGDLDVSDEFAWAAFELYATTGDTAYLEGLAHTPGAVWLARRDNNALRDISWPDTDLLIAATVLSAPNTFSDEQIDRAASTLIAAADRYVEDFQADGYGAPMPPDGYRWGSNGDVASRAIPLGYAYDLTGSDTYRNTLVAIMDYLLGRNPLDQSYVAGFGTRQVKFVHHRFWAAGADPAFPIAAPGALSGGPNAGYPSSDYEKAQITPCAPQRCWADDYTAFSINEVAINWNAALFWLTSYLDATPPTKTSPEPSP